MWISQLINNPVVMWNLGGAGAEAGGGGAPSTKPGDEQKMFCVCVWFFSLEPDQEERSNIKPKCGEQWYLIPHQNTSSMSFKCHMKKSHSRGLISYLYQCIAFCCFIPVSPYYIWMLLTLNMVFITKLLEFSIVGTISQGSCESQEFKITYLEHH